MGFPERLNAFFKTTGAKKNDLPEQLGVSRTMLFAYLAGKNEPPVSFFQAVKTAFPWVNVEWLITGIGEMKVAGGTAATGCFDADLLRQAIDVVETALEETGRAMLPRKKADLVVAIYELYAESGEGVDKAKVLKLIKSAA